VKDYQERPPFDDESKRSELLRLLNEIDGIVLPTNKSYPSCTLAKLGDEKSIDQFLHAFDWAVAKLQAS
jgi:hypothetical protein